MNIDGYLIPMNLPYFSLSSGFLSIILENLPITTQSSGIKPLPNVAVISPATTVLNIVALLSSSTNSILSPSMMFFIVWYASSTLLALTIGLDGLVLARTSKIYSSFKDTSLISCDNISLISLATCLIPC